MPGDQMQSFNIAAQQARRVSPVINVAASTVNSGVVAQQRQPSNFVKSTQVSSLTAEISLAALQSILLPMLQRPSMPGTNPTVGVPAPYPPSSGNVLNGFGLPGVGMYSRNNAGGPGSSGGLIGDESRWMNEVWDPETYGPRPQEVDVKPTIQCEDFYGHYYVSEFFYPILDDFEDYFSAELANLRRGRKVAGTGYGKEDGAAADDMMAGALASMRKEYDAIKAEFERNIQEQFAQLEGPRWMNIECYRRSCANHRICKAKDFKCQIRDIVGEPIVSNVMGLTHVHRVAYYLFFVSGRCGCTGDAIAGPWLPK